jgi:hypothetical protein
MAFSHADMLAAVEQSPEAAWPMWSISARATASALLPSGSATTIA